MQKVRSDHEEIEEIDITHVQTVLPSNIVKELKKRTKKTSIKAAISKAVYYYLKDTDGK